MIKFLINSVLMIAFIFAYSPTYTNLGDNENCTEDCFTDKFTDIEREELFGGIVTSWNYYGDGWNRTTDTGLMRALLCL